MRVNWEYAFRLRMKIVKGLMRNRILDLSSPILTKRDCLSVVRDVYFIKIYFVLTLF